jgi:hypothetical protein
MESGHFTGFSKYAAFGKPGILRGFQGQYSRTGQRSPGYYGTFPLSDDYWEVSDDNSEVFRITLQTRDPMRHALPAL